MRAILTFFLLIATASPALARDSSHLICAGFMAAKPDPDNYGFAVQFDEGRASDGSSRKEMLSTVWAGNLYQGFHLNSSDDFGQKGKVEMAGSADPKAIFYVGAYNLIQNKKTGHYSLQLKGRMNTVPAADSTDFEAISTVLNCTDISN